MRAVILAAALLSTGASAAPRQPDAAPDSGLPVAISQPLSAMKGGSFVFLGGTQSRRAIPESAMLVLVGSGLIGLASLVRRTT